MSQRRYPSIGACALGEALCASEPLLPVCAPYSPEHRPHPTGVGLVGDQEYTARLVDGQFVACHRYRIPTSGSLAGPTIRPFAPPSLEGGPAGLRETMCATSR